jgi:hypothetical protein
MTLIHDCPDCYWRVTLSGILGGYDIENGEYKGWCADPSTGIGGTHNTTLYSVYDCDLPFYAQNENWPKINYMVNEYRKGNYDCATKYEIQKLIWDYLGYSAWGWGAVNASCEALVKADVDSNGNGYIPQRGDLVAVLCDTDSGELQLIFIELQYFFAPEMVAAVVVIALISPAFAYLLRKRRE